MSNTIEAEKQEADRPRRPKKVVVHDPMGAREVAEALGIRVQNLQYVKELPDAVVSIAASRLWDGRDIRKFAAREARRKAQARQAKAAA